MVLPFLALGLALGLGAGDGLSAAAAAAAAALAETFFVALTLAFPSGAALPLAGARDFATGLASGDISNSDMSESCGRSGQR